MKQPSNTNLIGGLILIAIGLFALLTQVVSFDQFGFANLGLYFVAGLGAIFMLAGIATREPGFFIPGGILSGIGWGIVLTAGSLGEASGIESGSLFMIAFGFGWFTIPLFTAIFTQETHWWPLIPGSIMILIGLAVGLEGVFLTLLTLLGRVWPLFLVFAGLAMLVGALRRSNNEKTPEDLLK